MINFDLTLYIKTVKNLGKQCVLLYLGSMLSLGATLLVVSVGRVKRDLGT